jgi:hypothetical protein
MPDEEQFTSHEELLLPSLAAGRGRTSARRQTVVCFIAGSGRSDFIRVSPPVGRLIAIRSAAAARRSNLPFGVGGIGGRGMVRRRLLSLLTLVIGDVRIPAAGSADDQDDGCDG